MTPKELQQKIVEEVLLKLHAQTIVDRDVILGLAENEKNSQALIHREVANVEVDFNYIAEEIIRIRGATTSLSTLTRFKSDTHQEWLDRKRQQIENGKHWSTFRRYISRSLSEKQVNELDRSSDEILSSIEDPERSGFGNREGSSSVTFNLGKQLISLPCPTKL